VNYHPELGNWIITLGRYDIAYAIYALSKYARASTEGNWVALQIDFGYL